MVDCQITADDTGKSKPAPDIFEAAVNRLEVGVDNAIAIGDTRFDVEAAKRIGLRTIGFLCGRAADEQMLRQAGAIAVYEGPADLLEHYDTSPLAE